LPFLAGYKPVKRGWSYGRLLLQIVYPVPDLSIRPFRIISKTRGDTKVFLAIFSSLEKFEGTSRVSRFPPIAQGLTKCSHTDRGSRRRSYRLTGPVLSDTRRQIEACSEEPPTSPIVLVELCPMGAIIRRAKMRKFYAVGLMCLVAEFGPRPKKARD